MMSFEGEMENSTVSCSWWCTTIPSSSSSSSSPDHQLRLLLTLSELNKNVTALLRLMQQEDGETPTRQTETGGGACPARTELRRRVEEFYSSYCSLAGYWGDQFGTKKNLLLPDEDSPEDGQRSHVTAMRDVDDAEKSLVKKSNGDPEGPPPALDAAGSLDRHAISRSEQMSRIAEDVVGELARRYDERREANRVLRRQAERLVEECRVLRLDCERLASENGALRSKPNNITGAGQSCPRCCCSSRLVKKQRRPLFFFSRFKSLFSN